MLLMPWLLAPPWSEATLALNMPVKYVRLLGDLNCRCHFSEEGWHKTQIIHMMHLEKKSARTKASTHCCLVMHITDMATCIWVNIGLTQITKFLGTTWGPPGSSRPQMAPCWPHEPCYQGSNGWLPGGNILARGALKCKLLKFQCCI